MYEVAIIGGGPAGLSAAMYLARVGGHVVIVDAGKPRHAVADGIHSLVTHDGRPPAEFRRLANEQLAAYGDRVTRHVGTVSAITGERDAFTVATSGGSIEARRVLLALGVRDVLPTIPGVAEAWATSVHHCPWCWGWEGRGGRMGVLVTKPHAVMQSLVLARLAREVEIFWAADEPISVALREALVARGVVVREAGVRALEVDGRQLRAVVTTAGETVPLDALYLHPTQAQDPLVATLGLNVADGGVVVDATGQTSTPGIYAAGDMVAKTKQHVLPALAAGADAGVAIVIDLVGVMQMPMG